MSKTKKEARCKGGRNTDARKREGFQFSTTESTGFLVRAVNRALQRALQERISLRGVTPGQWYFLRVLWEEEGLTQRDLSARVGMTEPTAVVAINGMEKAKLVRRVRSEKDRRKSYVFLTKKGMDLREVMLPLAKEVNDIAISDVPPRDLTVLRRVLKSMIDNFEKSKT